MFYEDSLKDTHIYVYIQVCVTYKRKRDRYAPAYFACFLLMARASLFLLIPVNYKVIIAAVLHGVSKIYRFN